jgi:hypothetical protein
MNIKQALKLKNKLVKENNETFAKLSQYNSVEEGTVRPYDPKEMLAKWNEGVKQLVDLKTKIHRANAPVYDKIFKLSELKSMVSRLNSLGCVEGKQSQRGGWGQPTEPVVMIAEIGIVQRDEMIKTLENQIEQIQDELDVHNANTEI